MERIFLKSFYVIMYAFEMTRIEANNKSSDTFSLCILAFLLTNHMVVIGDDNQMLAK